MLDTTANFRRFYLIEIFHKSIDNAKRRIDITHFHYSVMFYNVLSQSNLARVNVHRDYLNLSVQEFFVE